SPHRCNILFFDAIMPIFCVSFFFYGSVAHRDLHSLPTRRSSDLSSRLRPAFPRPSIPSCRTGSCPCSSTSSRTPTTSMNTGTSRSEEHTSELQSQSNLVCRLLLEKKKKKNVQTNSNHIDDQTATK